MGVVRKSADLLGKVGGFWRRWVLRVYFDGLREHDSL